MKTTEIRKLKADELGKSIEQKRTELAELRQSYRTEETKNVRSIRAIRKDIARLLSIKQELTLREKTDV